MFNWMQVCTSPSIYGVTQYLAPIKKGVGSSHSLQGHTWHRGAFTNFGMKSVAT